MVRQLKENRSIFIHLNTCVRLNIMIHAMLKMACGSEDAAGQFAMGTPSREPKKVYSGKTDVSSTFSLVPLLWQCWKWLVMKAQHPETGQWL